MAAVEPVSLGGLHTLADNPYRVILTDNAREADALAAIAPANPRVWFPGLAADADFGSLANREVIVWVSRPTEGYWLAGSAVAWLRRLCAVTPAVKIVCSDDAVGPAKLPPDTTLADWLPQRLVPASQVLPDNVVPIKPQQPAAAPPSRILLTEDALAAAFTVAHPNMRYVALWGQWLEWDGSRWETERTGLALDYAYQTCLVESDRHFVDVSPSQYARARTERARCAVEKLARTSRAHASKPEAWDADTWALCTPGGIVDLHTGQLRPATPQDLVIKQTRNTPRGDCPLWLRFLDEATGGDKQLQVYLQRIAGYMLTGATTEECFFFAYGPGGNGKGTYINTLTAILGDYAQVSNMDVFMESKGDRHLTEIAGLRGARMVSAQETEDGRRWAEGKLKTMTGSDPLRARFMRQDEFTFIPQFKLILAGNNKPALRSLDDAMRRRMNLIPFTVKFDGAKRDNGLKSKLMAEGDGILAWAVQGCVDWQRDGLATPPSVLKATADYFDDQDVVKHWITESCEIHPQAKGPSQPLYESFREWAKANGETYIMPQRRFRQRLLDLGHADKRTSRGVYYEGIKLADSMTMARGYQQDPIPGFD